MPEFISALIYDSAINLAGLERDKNAAIAKLHSIGAEATKTFQNEIARSLAKSVRPEVFAGDLAKSRALLQGFGNDANKIFEKALGRRAAQQLLSPFVDELTTLKGQFKSSLSEVFSLKNLAGGFLTASAITGAVRGLFEVGKATIAIARDAQETRNKFDVLFGGLKNEVREFANVYAQEVGRSRIQTENFLSTINGIFTTVGFAGREAAEFSKNITKLTFDLASFFNTTDAEALTALRSGLIGESEPLRRFNVFLSEARVAQEALAQGINKTSKELTEQDKIFLRYQIILKDTTAAQGDAVRTSDSLANQQKRLSANLENLGDTIGETLVPALADATAGLNTFLENLTKTFTGKNASLISSFFGGIREDAKRMQEELDAISKNRTTLLFPTQNNAFVSQADAIKKVLELQKGLTLETVTVEAERYEVVKKTRAELDEIAKAAERTRKELEAMAVIKLPDYLTKSKQNFEFGKIRGADNKPISDAQFKKELEVLLNIKLTPMLKIDAKKITGLEKVSDDIRGLLSNIAFPIEAFLIDMERLGIATQDELVQLADLFDRGVGDIVASFLNLKTQLKSGTLLGSFLGGTGLVSAVAPILSGLLGSFFGESEQTRKIRESQRLSEERAAEATQRLNDEMERLSETILSLSLAEINVELKKIKDEFFGLTDISIKGLERIIALDREAKGLLDAIDEAKQRGDFDLAELLQQDLDKIIAEMKSLGVETIGIFNSLSVAQLAKLRELAKGNEDLLKQLEQFGRFADNFSGLLDSLNLRFDLLNISDAGQKLTALQQEIKKKFGAIIPVTQSGIRDLIAQGLAALEAGGKTLEDFLRSLDLEEFAPDDLRKFLQLLNSLANDLNKQLGEATDPTTRVALIRSITFEQGNRLLDENTTMRILQTNMVDIQMQMLSIMKDSLRGGLSSAALSRGGAANIFIMRDGNVRRASSSELTELERLQADRFLAEAKGMGLA